MKILFLLTNVACLFAITSCDSYKLPDGIKSIKITSPITGIKYDVEKNKKGELDVIINSQK